MISGAQPVKMIHGEPVLGNRSLMGEGIATGRIASTLENQGDKQSLLTITYTVDNMTDLAGRHPTDADIALVHGPARLDQMRTDLL
jgi:hypothetical protein